ncbi:WD repeat-containing protein 3 isoform X1 [Hippopotamus amphibius kiboko]|uniref:WD repeat-containing protein 3 isoform X1 n=1 Tax=Hippopotamus amphibius kiboko TaxID=575201 RepID=UPI00259646FF|nr:WD repeat-containing protein 3 isoform X1 [Hippopotamus amphibius kiboko]XP_057576686.1 WD repeat-containing protein 3 isoform X1 [Hippopotamus amphibius kiboko]XP_057576690.1 WD repeat-containing protein 3 isoform X1 [Hippopotamus amphibius kiboko]XP_057576694.1 WD repeat-containing protein 3 isoform X1 [Hippopotamus amphibius kiboko]
MGLTKQYLRYVASAVFGLIGSQKGNIVFVTLRGEKGRYVAVPACEHVFIWDLRKGEKILILQGLKHEVTCLCPSPDGLHLAVGYEDGSIRIFSLLSGEGNVTFNGHKAAITSLKYDQLGGRLASGSKDTDVIVWDVINESGLYRLKGHKDAITQALFLRDKNLLVTSGKDTMVKWWDLDTQHCFKTMVGHRTEVWGLVLVSEEKRLITGASDSELRAWDIAYLQEIEDPEEPEPKKIKGSSPGVQDTHEAEDGTLEMDEAPEDRILTCRKAGSIMREGRDRVVNLAVDRTGRILACHGTDSVLEVFRILSKEEIQKKMDKKMKKAKKKAKLNSCREEEEDLEVSVEMILQDEIQRVTNIKTAAKIKSFDLIHTPQGELKAVFLLQNNLVELYSLHPSLPAPQPARTNRITLGGHRSDVRTLSFSSDNIAVLSAAADSIKIWNRSTLQCIRTMTCEYALCSFFVPGDRQVVIGTKTGKLQLYDLASGNLLETIDAHDGALWSLSLSPDQRGFVTGGADKSVKFWDFELVKDENGTQKRLSVKQTRTLQLDEEVLCVSYSPNQKLLAVSLLDCTVKIFYVDTLKFFLSLYGHKLPVICMDISYDGVLIATGSADRNVKIWGLDFGDCHKSLFAHDDSVMYLKFVPKSHLFFTAGKDHKIKQWDADKFEHIQTLEGHHQEIWCLAVSPSGDYVVSSSHDKSLRLWERTREPLILEEEREMQREAEYEESVAKEDQPAVPGETQGDNYFTGKKTIETVKAAERIMEAVELYRGETAKMREHKAICKAAGKEVPLPINPILMAYGSISPSAYVLEVFKGIKSSELEESLLVLPFSYVPDILKLFNEFIQLGSDVELVCRCLFFLLRIHFGQITSNQMLVPVIEKLKETTISKVSQVRDVIGFNMAGLDYLKRECEAKSEVMFFADATSHLEEKKRKRKKREKMILTLT